jgi:hypothetical protein
VPSPCAAQQILCMHISLRWTDTFQRMQSPVTKPSHSFASCEVVPTLLSPTEQRYVSVVNLLVAGKGRASDVFNGCRVMERRWNPFVCEEPSAITEYKIHLGLPGSHVSVAPESSHNQVSGLRSLPQTMGLCKIYVTQENPCVG